MLAADQLTARVLLILPLLPQVHWRSAVGMTPLAGLFWQWGVSRLGLPVPRGEGVALRA